MPLGDLVVTIGGDISGFREAMQEGIASSLKFSQTISSQGASLGILEAQYKAASSAIRSSVAQIATAENAAAGQIIQGHTAAAATLQARANAERATLNSLIQAQSRLAASMAEVKYSMVSVNQSALDLTGGLMRLTLAQAVVAQEAQRMGVNLLQAQEEVQSFVGLIPGLGRAAEHFVNLIPGFGAIIMKAFPVLGAIAFGQSLFYIGQRLVGLVGPSEELKKAQEDLARAIKETDDAYLAQIHTLDQIGTHKMGRDFGPSAEAKARVHEIGREIGDIQNEILARNAKINEIWAFSGGDRSARAASSDEAVMHPIDAVTGRFIAKKEEETAVLEEEINKQQALLGTKYAEMGDASDQAAKESASQTGAILAAQTANQKQELGHRLADLKDNLLQTLDQHHSTELQRIAGISDADTKTLESAKEEVRAAREKEEAILVFERAHYRERINLINQTAAAEKLGKDVAAQRKIDIGATGQRAEVSADIDAANRANYDARAEAERKLALTTIEVVKAQAEDAKLVWLTAYDAITSAADKAQNVLDKAVEADLANRTKVSESQDKGKGETDALNVERDRLGLARQYALLIAPTARQQIAYAQQVAEIEQRARNAKIAGLAAERQTSLATDPNVDTNTKAADIQEQINKLRAEGDNRSFEAQTRILQLLQRQRLEVQLKGDFESAIHQIPGAVGGGLARGIMDGKSIGKDIREAMKGVGEQLMGRIFEDLIVKIGAEIAAHTFVAGVMGWLGSAQALNTAAVHANTAAQLKSGAAGIAKGAGGLGGAASGGGSAASSAASTAAGGLVGPLIAAAGGIIGGVISGVMSLIGAHQIVKAINATTAAVQALHGTVNTSTDAPRLGSGAPATATPGASGGGIGGFFSSLLGFGGTKPVDVAIVSISPMSPLKGLFSMFGFAEGGIPPMGIPSIVGERGPELFIPHQLGTIIPNHQLKAFAAKGGAMMTSISSTSSSQTGGNHTFNIHGATNPRETARAVATYLKTASPQFSPYSR